MNLLKYTILFLFLLNISGAAFQYIGPGILAAIINYFAYLLLLLYYLLIKKQGFNKWMIIIGVLYFVISGFQFEGDTGFYISNFIKYLIAVVCGYELIRNTSNREFFFFLLLGALTILLHATAMTGGSDEYGRFSGFYINPNSAGFICASGYALSFSIKNKKVRLIGQLVLTLMGLLTLSRTFMGTWLLVNLLSLRVDVKNAKIFLYGFGLLFLFIGIGELLGVRNVRLEQLKSLTEKEHVKVEDIKEGSRDETWAKFYDDIKSKPIFGSGYFTFQGNTYKHSGGVHNTFLLILGESGILPFLIFVFFYGSLLISSLQLFRYAPNLFMQCLVLILFLAVSHVYFTHHFIIFISMWIQNQIKQYKWHARNH